MFQKRTYIMCATIKKIYIDKAHKLSDSAHYTDFKIDLPIKLSLPAHTCILKKDLEHPLSFNTIESCRNNYNYVCSKKS